jgi:hypothetical protein
MRTSMRLVLVAVVGLAFLGGERVTPAAEGGCQGCGTNSPVINTFPFMWIKSGSLEVGQGHSNCPIDERRKVNKARAILVVQDVNNDEGDKQVNEDEAVEGVGKDDVDKQRKAKRSSLRATSSRSYMTTRRTHPYVRVRIWPASHSRSIRSGDGLISGAIHC